MQNKDKQQKALSLSLMLYIVIRQGTPCRIAESKVNAGIGDVGRDAVDPNRKK
jgi:hypothetical protein